MRAICSAALAFLLAACTDGAEGDDGPPGPPGPAPTDDELDAGEDPPGVVLTIVSVQGASGASGNFLVGDRIEVRYRLEKADGTRWPLAEMAFGRAHFAGPAFQYQRVLAETDDVAARTTEHGDGSYTYTFGAKIPAEYLPPYNDSPSFGAADGELAGQPLLGGTYTVGMSFGWRYTVEGEQHVQVGEATRDVLLGGATELAPRRVTAAANCNRCHVSLTYHDGERGELTQCLMCHTTGAEDLNDPAIGGGTPGVSIESRVLFHKLHDAAHLPSVVGVGVLPDGNPDYGADPTPLRYARASGELVDFSFVDFPAWPNRTIPREKNFGYSALDEAERAREDAVRTGIVACHVCHGDPDGDGPLEAPEDGELVFAQPSRRACGACHDDVDWDLPYTVNFQEMPPQPDDAGCTECHSADPGPLSSVHLHPLDDPFVTTGLVLEVQSVQESGAHDGSGTVDPGEKIAVTFTLVDGDGADVDPAGLEAVPVVLAGPSSNLQLVASTAIPIAALGGPQPFTVEVPETRLLEFVGDSSAAGGEVFATARRPHLDLPGAETVVAVRTATGVATSLVAPAGPTDHSVEVASSAGIERDQVVVLDDGVPGLEEYLRVQYVDGNRLWFSSPATPAYGAGPEREHAAGAGLAVVSLATLAPGVDYALNPAAGTVTELAELGPGAAVLVSYTTHFVMPERYPRPLHGSPDLDETHGEWSGKTLVPGTYSLSIWAQDTVVTSFAGESNVYPVSSIAERVELAVAGAAIDAPYDLIASAGACDACHQDLRYHDGRFRGFDSCLPCHGAAGGEDRPPYVSAAAPATPGVEIGFRQLLHRIHMGMRLSDAPGYAVVGAGSEPYPDDFTVKTYEDVLFPAQPQATKNCTKCHGESSAWLAPGDRDHPAEQDLPVRSWRAACASCHDSPAAGAHVDSHTAPSGVESCAVCHGPGETWSVERVHHPY